MPILDQHAIEILSHSPEETRRVGTHIGSLLQPGDLICLQGNLGAGKTTFVQGIAEGWGSLDEVSSPTFILVNQYRRSDGARLFHTDAYRIESGLEAAELDLDGMLAEGALIVEWPERVGSVLSLENLRINFDYRSDQERQISIKASGKRYENMLVDLRQTMLGVV